MAKQSAGLLIYRRRPAGIEVFLVHPGGPFWQKKDDGAWSIPKGEFTAEEDPLAAAQREFHEETGLQISGNFTPLPAVKQRGGKTVYAWQVEADFDTSKITSNTFSMEWPPRSGKQQEFPEVDRADWFDLESAALKINEGQRPLLAHLKAVNL
jgi:predicted NUDIX family NTP pyrophosphohydrolase